jgi:hypothetical protein
MSTPKKTPDDQRLDRGFRAGWFLVAIAFAWVVAFWGFTVALHRDTPHPGWDLDDVPIVPASSIEADGYYQPVRTDHAP